MFLKQEFLFFDFEQSAVFVFAEYTAMMGLWVFISFYAVKGIRKITSQSRRKECVKRRDTTGKCTDHKRHSGWKRDRSKTTGGMLKCRRSTLYCRKSRNYGSRCASGRRND